MKRIVWFSLVVLLTLAGLYLLWEFRQAILLFLFSLAVAAVFRPAVERLVKRRLPRGLAILLVYLLGLGLFGLFIVFISGPLIRDLQLATNNLAIYYAHAQQVWSQGSAFQQTVARQMPPQENLYQAIAGEQGAALLKTVLGVATNLFNVLFSLGVVLALAIYWTADIFHFERLWLSTLPGNRRVRARQIWREIERGVGAYMRSEVFQSVSVAALLGAAYHLLGIEYPMLLAVLAALAWLIPWLGSGLAVIPAFWVGFSEQPLLGFYTAVVTLAVLFFLEVVVEPRLFNRRRYSSLLVVLMVVVLADSFGLIGLVLAPPFAAAIQILFTNLLAPSSVDLGVGSVEEIGKLRVQLQKIRSRAELMENPPPRVDNLAGRLDRLIDKTERILKLKATTNNS